MNIINDNYREEQIKKELTKKKFQQSNETLKVLCRLKNNNLSEINIELNNLFNNIFEKWKERYENFHYNQLTQWYYKIQNDFETEKIKQ